MLGVELPDGWDWDKIAKLKKGKAQAMADAMQGANNSNDPNADNTHRTTSRPTTARQLSLRRWRVKSNKRGKLAPFERRWIPWRSWKKVKAHGDNGWRDADDVIVATPSLMRAAVKTKMPVTLARPCRTPPNWCFFRALTASDRGIATMTCTVLQP